MDREYNVIILEDNIEYTEIDRIKYNNNIYTILSDLENPENFCIRKLVFDNNKEIVIGLDSKEEFDNVLKLFLESFND